MFTNITLNPDEDCIMSYFVKAPLTELAIQRDIPEKIRMSSDNERKTVEYRTLLRIAWERSFHIEGPVGYW